MVVRPLRCCGDTKRKGQSPVEYFCGWRPARKITRDVEDYDQRALWFSALPKERGCFTRAWSGDEDHESDEWLEVKKVPQEPELPAVPTLCKDWVTASVLRDKSGPPELAAEITVHVPNPNWDEDSDQPETISVLKRLDEHAEVQKVWESYVAEEWLSWRERHDSWERLNAVYSKLFPSAKNSFG